MSDLICHGAKVNRRCKVSAFHGWCYFFSVFNVLFDSNASIKLNKYIFHTLYIENNIRNIFRVSTFQQLSPNTAIFSTVIISRLMTLSLHLVTPSLLRIERFLKTKRKYILYTIKKTIIVTRFPVQRINEFKINEIQRKTP